MPKRISQRKSLISPNLRESSRWSQNITEATRVNSTRHKDICPWLCRHDPCVIETLLQGKFQSKHDLHLVGNWAVLAEGRG